MCSFRRGVLVLTCLSLAVAAGILSTYTSLLAASLSDAASLPDRQPAMLAGENSRATSLEPAEGAQSTAADTIEANGALSGSTPALVASDAADPPPLASKAPSLIEMLEGREPDMVIWIAIAAVFFFLGWIVGAIHAKRRERSRRSKLRF